MPEMLSRAKRVAVILFIVLCLLICLEIFYHQALISEPVTTSLKHITGGRQGKNKSTDEGIYQLSSFEYFSQVLHGHSEFIANEDRRGELNTLKNSSLACTKRIQIWRSDNLPQRIESCPGLPCGIKLVFNTSYETLMDSDAVLLFHASSWDWARIRSSIGDGQKLIFFSHESPPNTGQHVAPPEKYFSRAYDYYMSFRFREQGQLYGSYGYYDPLKPSVSLNDTRNWAAGRKQKVVWLAAKCKFPGEVSWDRTGFVKKLSKLVDVGIYGKCGEKPPCPSRYEIVGGKDYLTSCSEFLHQFKFYLALENSACRDYITEKFWSNAYMNDLIPIVFGTRRADYEAVAPPNSFIHVEDFKTLQGLADYINLLDRNDHLYNEFFRWKKHGSVVVTRQDWLFEPRNMCQVVHRILADEKAESDGKIINHLKSPTDFNNWWGRSCMQVPEFH